MSVFQRIVFPFSNTGAVCYLYEYENTLAHKYFNEANLLQEIENFKVREISNLVFFGFSKENKLDYYKKKLEFHGFACLNLLHFTHFSKRSTANLNNTIKDLELLIQFVGHKNFAICYPHSKEFEVLEYVVCAILFLDPENELEEVFDYFLGSNSIPFENSERIQNFQFYLKNYYSPVLKKFILPNETEEVSPQKTGESFKMKVGEFELNLNSLTEDENQYENPLELLEDVLDFAESFEEKLEEDEWKQAFPDTGKKIESNQTARDDLQSKKTTEVLKSEEHLEEDYTFSTLIDLDAITEEYLSLEEDSQNQTNPNKKTQEGVNNVPAFHEKESLPEKNQDTQEDLLSYDDLALEIPLDFTSETMDAIQAEVEIDSEPSLTSLDRQIKDALTKEVLVEEEDPRKKKDSSNRESKPKTIIITPENKEEKVSPLSKERLESLKEEFNAIQLD